MTTVVTGVGIEMMRYRLWISAARMAQQGLRVSRNATLANWRAQTGSTAKTWRQVALEAAKAHDAIAERAARIKARELRLRVLLSRPERLSEVRQVLLRVRADQLAALLG